MKKMHWLITATLLFPAAAATSQNHLTLEQCYRLAEANYPLTHQRALITSTRDLLLSDTAIFHRALLGAGGDAQLIVFEALPHAFWYHFQLPETKEALGLMAKFFDDKVGK